MSHYDKSLRYRLNATNGETGIVLNRNFSGWEHIIRENIVGYESRRYTREELSLLKDCREHASAFSRRVESGNIIAFVHPIYLYLSHMDQLDDRMKGEADEYFCNLMKIMKAGIPKDKAGRVLIETVHHYAAATSLLMEEGYLDAVIFTGYDCGIIDDAEEARGFHGKNFFFGGGYNQRCLSDAIGDVCDITGNKKAWAVKEICIDSPQDGRSLKTSCVGTELGKCIEVDMISMHDLGKYIGADIVPKMHEKGLMTAAY